MPVNTKQARALEQHFEWLHKNPPAHFNPDFNPKAKDVWGKVTQSMEDDNFYASHTREECAAEWKKRYEERMAAATAK